MQHAVMWLNLFIDITMQAKHCDFIYTIIGYPIILCFHISLCYSDNTHSIKIIESDTLNQLLVVHWQVLVCCAFLDDSDAPLSLGS
jgi:hypothetical protein